MTIGVESLCNAPKFPTSYKSGNPESKLYHGHFEQRCQRRGEGGIEASAFFKFDQF